MYSQNSNSTQRLGFHYYPDTLHYRESDLKYWLPKLRSIGASWLVLNAPADRAIPEFFISELLESRIEPVLHFLLPIENQNWSERLELLFNCYARWGVKFVTLFDRPNVCNSWTAASWAQEDLVERFLDIYLPLADRIVANLMIPVFPPLEPGGDYWDTAFLKASLHGIKRRNCTWLLDTLVLSAYAWTNSKTFDWGAGGPERWPSAQPYSTPEDSQDHQGFHIFDWYLAMSKAELDRYIPILLMAAGNFSLEGSTPKSIEESAVSEDEISVEMQALSQRVLNLLVKLLQRPGFSPNPSEEPAMKSLENHPLTLEPVPPEVLACNFWLLAAEKDSQYASYAWFRPDGKDLPVVKTLQNWHSTQQHSIS